MTMYDNIIANVTLAFEDGEQNPYEICIGENCPYYHMDSAMCRNCDA